MHKVVHLLYSYLVTVESQRAKRLKGRCERNDFDHVGLLYHKAHFGFHGVCITCFHRLRVQHTPIGFELGKQSSGSQEVIPSSQPKNGHGRCLILNYVV